VVGLTAVLLCLGAVAFGGRQRGDAQSPFPNSPPKSLQFKPVSMSNVVGGRDTLRMFHTPKIQTPLNLGSMFHKTQQPSWPPKLASAPMVSPNSNPFQPNPPKSQYIINPTPPGPKSKTIWNYLNPFSK
jgi:hypothetical protein